MIEDPNDRKDQDRRVNNQRKDHGKNNFEKNWQYSRSIPKYKGKRREATGDKIVR